MPTKEEFEAIIKGLGLDPTKSLDGYVKNWRLYLPENSKRKSHIGRVNIESLKTIMNGISKSMGMTFKRASMHGDAGMIISQNIPSSIKVTRILHVWVYRSRFQSIGPHWTN